MKKAIIIIILIIITLLAINIITGPVMNHRNKYNLIKNAHHLNDYLFNNGARKMISLKSAMGNKDEQIYFYNFDYDYDLIVWNIKGFSKVNLAKIHLYEITNFNSILINPQRFFEMGYFKAISESAKLMSENMTIYTNQGARILNHFEKPDTAYLDIISDGLMLGHENNYFIKIVAKTPIHFSFLFLKDSNGFHFIILSSKNNKNKMRDNMLMGILSHND